MNYIFLFLCAGITLAASSCKIGDSKQNISTENFVLPDTSSIGHKTYKKNNQIEENSDAEKTSI